MQMSNSRDRTKLDIGQQRKNVFVTQLHQREDEEYEAGERRLEIVPEGGSQLLETGLNTLQRTLMLRRTVEYENVDAELREKRAEFKRRMEICAKRQLELQKRQQAFRDRVTKFERFINENEVKRRRAINKYYTEAKARENKSREIEALSAELADLKEKCESKTLAEKLIKFKKFEGFLHKVIEISPTNFVEASDNMVAGLMLRHTTLDATRQANFERSEQLNEEMKEKKLALENEKRMHEQTKLSHDYQLNSLKKQEDEVRSRLENLEQRAAIERAEVRRAVAGVGQLCQAVNNLAEKVASDREAIRRTTLLRPAAGGVGVGVGRATGASEEAAGEGAAGGETLSASDAAVGSLTWAEKLDSVKEFLIDKDDVVRMASGELPIPATDNEIRQRVKRMSDQILAQLLRQMRAGSGAEPSAGAGPDSDDESPRQTAQRRPLASIRS